MRRISLALVGMVLLVALGLLGYCSLRPLPGAGAAYQDAPDTAVAGRTALLSLRLAVWGAGAAAGERYSEVRLQWRLRRTEPGVTEWQALVPSKALTEGGPHPGLTYHFELPVPDVPAALIDYRFFLRVRW